MQQAMRRCGQSAGVQRNFRRATIGATRVLAFALYCWALPSRAEPPKSIIVELNKLEQEGGNCRAYLVIANPGTDTFSVFTLDLFIFDSGTILRRLAIELSPIRPAKTMVKVFDIPQTACGTIGSILVNDVLHCRDAIGDVADCVDRISTSSKLPVTLSK
ncbi:MAG: Tat pathway signal sequence domain protein [Acetobacteraceae bacterium]|nr:Tat pathway signal sequence domain protein [Acetobacteraceae bacterium]